MTAGTYDGLIHHPTVPIMFQQNQTTKNLGDEQHQSQKNRISSILKKGLFLLNFTEFCAILRLFVGWVFLSFFKKKMCGHGACHFCWVQLKNVRCCRLINMETHQHTLHRAHLTTSSRANTHGLHISNLVYLISRTRGET